MLPFDLLYFGGMLFLLVFLLLKREKNNVVLFQGGMYLTILVRYFMLRTTQFNFGFVFATVIMFLLSYSISLWRTALAENWKKGMIEVSLTLLPLLGSIAILTGIYM